MNYFIQTNRLLSFKKHKLCFGCCDHHQLYQTSTLGGRSLVEISTKLRHPQCRSLVEVWSKFGRRLVEVSTLGVSKFGRHFGQTSTLGVSKFGRNFDQTSTRGGRSLVEISTKLRHPHRSK